MGTIWEAIKQRSVSLLGAVLLIAGVGRVFTDGDDLIVDSIEVLLPILVGFGLVVGGIWLQNTETTDRITKIAYWAIGGWFLGVGVNLWYLFIISLEVVPTGEPIVLNLNAAAIFAGVGTVLGYFWTGIRENEQELQASESRFRALTENAPFVVITIDDESRIRYANDVVEDFFGYSPAELIGKPVTQLTPERLHEGHRNRIGQIRSDDAAIPDHHIELTGLDQSGNEFPIEVSFGKYTVEGQQLLTGIVRDISERKEAAERIEQHTSRLRELHQIASTIGEAESEEEIYERATSGAVAVFRADMAQVFRAEDDQISLVHRSGSEKIEEYDYTSMIYTCAKESLGKGEVLRIDDLLDTRSASSSPSQDDNYTQRHRSLMCIPLSGYGVLQVFSVMPDAFVEEDEEVGELLGEHVATALQRIQVEEDIRRERDRMNEFASILSHDIRNPLSVAKGRLTLLEDAGTDENTEAIRRSLDRIERLIEDTLTLAKQGEEVVETENVDLASAAKSGWGMVDTAAATLEMEATDSVEADRSRLCQIFENLFRNAIDHGGPDVDITVGQVENGFYVEDSGPGIPEDKRDEIFRSGYSTQQDGTGFGLSIVHRIVDAHGWQIEVVDGEGSGARFEVTGVTFN